ncbi:Serine carboxypeptidase-like 51 [Bienertia sinuspersici]
MMNALFFITLFLLLHGSTARLTKKNDGTESEEWGYVEGASGTGIGNFQEVGPLDTDLNPRNSTWLKKADLLFVDNPVGTGYSYVEDKALVVKSDEEAGDDLTELLKEIFNKNVKLQKSPLYVVAESYGGKFAVTLGLAAHRAIRAGQLKLKLGGIALGDTWISPQDFVSSWGSLLKDVSRIDDEGFQQANSLAEKIKQQIQKGAICKCYGNMVYTREHN